MRTSGFSNKLAAALKTLGGPGILLVIIGLAVGNDALLTAGITLLVGGGAVGVVGYQADPDVTEYDPQLNVPPPTPLAEPRWSSCSTYRARADDHDVHHAATGHITYDNVPLVEQLAHAGDAWARRLLDHIDRDGRPPGVTWALGYYSCSVSDVTQDVGGTPRDARCHALIGHRGWLYALLVIVPPAITLIAGLVRPLRRVTMAACIVTTLVLVGYLSYLGQAPSVTLAP